MKLRQSKLVCLLRASLIFALKARAYLSATLPGLIEWAHIHNSRIFFITYEWAQKARVLVHGKPIQSSLMFVSQARAYPSEAPFRP